ncbi:MAG: hypothetical protein LBM78_03620 [Clostridiales bacterium]|jgi:ATP-binding cassette subfamily B protein|nr:hypothetical protein [Clostridiales bacterium]
MSEKHTTPMTKNKDVARAADPKRTLRRLVKYLLPYKWRLLAAAVLSLGANVSALLGPFLSGAAIDAMVGEGAVDFSAVSLYCGLMAGFY